MPSRKRRAYWSSSSLDLDYLNWAPAPEPEGPEAIPEMKLLTQQKVKELLIQAAEMNPDVHNLVTDAIEAVKAQERERFLYFGSESADVWHEINTEHRRMRDSRQFDISFEVVDYVKSTINNILHECQLHPNPKTRFNGLSVLRKIGKTISLSGGHTLGHEVQKQFQRETCLEDSMYEIVSAMSMEERENIYYEQSSPEALWLKLEELEEFANDRYLFEGLRSVMRLLSDSQNEGSDDEDYDDHYDEEHTGDGKDYTTLAWDWREAVQQDL